MFIERSVAGLDEVLEACATAEGVSEHSELYPSRFLEIGGGHGSG